MVRRVSIASRIAEPDVVTSAKQHDGWSKFRFIDQPTPGRCEYPVLKEYDRFSWIQHPVQMQDVPVFGSDVMVLEGYIEFPKIF